MQDQLKDGGFELDPDTLKTAEFLQVRALLDALVGKTIVATSVEHGRASITTADGTTLVFCGFGGSDRVGPG